MQSSDEEILEGEIIEAEPQDREADAPEPDEIAALRSALADAEQRAADHLDGWQRSQATLANYRKRAEADRQEWEVMATASLLTRLLPVLDDFERAFANLPAALRQHSWLDGIALIEAKIRRVLETEGVTQIVIAPGDPFDPFYHQAVAAQETTEYDEDCLLAEAQHGYLLNARVLRPALVVVAKSPAATDKVTPPEETSAEPNDA